MNKNGFTLVELLAVIAILALLVIIALPNVLNMFNQAKKDVFLTEAKTIYKEVSKKYISENMKGNKITNISNDNNKLDIESNDLEYNFKLDSRGNIKKVLIGNDSYCLNGKFSSIGELTVDKVTEGKCEYIGPKSFEKDSLKTIVDAVIEEDTDLYNVGDTKEIDLGTYGKHIIRVANKSTPSECNNENFSQTACGFVIEFVDIITGSGMNDSNTNVGGWSTSKIRNFVNTQIYNSLPRNLKRGIINTRVISGHGKDDNDNFVTTDKLYLLSTAEIWWQDDDTIKNDTARDVTRQLDYYKFKNTTVTNISPVIKSNGENNPSPWRIRTPNSNFNNYFYFVHTNGNCSYTGADNIFGVSPAFRIG
ncbi:MAG: type II secretion system GspH family protein [Tenericutes bacterium]|nr:type II secretion system GspH family protein [Mycoplasmatota bacterium]